MATTSSTTKAKPDNQNLTTTRSLGRKPKPPLSTTSSEDGSDHKPEKPLPNYLKPTISSRPDPVKFLKKNNNSLDDNQKLLRRRSFDRPPSSLTSPSTSFPRIQKSLNVSPIRPRDRPAVPREKPVTGTLRSSSFHGSRSVPRGGSTTAKSPPVAPKKSGLSSTSTSLKSKKEGSENVTTKKATEKKITLDSAYMSSAQKDDHQEEILEVESDVQVTNHDIEEPKDEKEDKEVQVEVVQADESGEEKNESGGPTTVASPVEEDCIAVIKEEDEILIKEDQTEERIEETREQEKENNGEDAEEDKKKIDEDETPEKVDIDMEKEVESVEVSTKDEKEEVKEEKEVKEEEKAEKVKEEEKAEKVKEEEKEKVNEEEKEKLKEKETEEAKKREVVKGKKESPSAYNDVIASKMQENPRKNKVLALAGAFQTVIDYETAASK